MSETKKQDKYYNECPITNPFCRIGYIEIRVKDEFSKESRIACEKAVFEQIQNKAKIELLEGLKDDIEIHFKTSYTITRITEYLDYKIKELKKEA